MTELSLTRIFSVTMYYHFAFMAISIALFGLSASGVYVFLWRERFAGRSTAGCSPSHALAFGALTMISLAVLVRVRVGLQSTPSSVALMAIDLPACRAAVLRRRRGRVDRDCPAERQRESGLRRRSARRRRRVSAPPAGAQSAGRARRDRRGGGYRQAWRRFSSRRRPARGRLRRSWVCVAVAILVMRGIPARSVHRQHHQGARAPCRALQQMELVFANRRVRSAVRRVVAERALYRPAARHAPDGHRLGGRHADPPLSAATCVTLSTCNTS